MNETKRILHKYLCEDAIELLALEEKDEAFVWLEEQGYYRRTRELGKNATLADALRESTKRGWTEKGKKEWQQKYDKLYGKHSKRVKDKSFEPNNLSKLKRELREYVRKNPNIDIYKGLTESETFAFRHVFSDPW